MTSMTEDHGFGGSESEAEHTALNDKPHSLTRSSTLNGDGVRPGSSHSSCSSSDATIRKGETDDSGEHFGPIDAEEEKDEDDRPFLGSSLNGRVEGAEIALRVQSDSSPDSPDGFLSTRSSLQSLETSHSSMSSSRPASLLSGSRISRSSFIQPFERRFSARLSASPLASPRALSPAFLTNHSRQSSISSLLPHIPDGLESNNNPWEVIRWLQLKKVTGQAFSEMRKRNFGRPTCLAVSTVVVIGTSKGVVLVFDYHQTLKSIIGIGTKALEYGAVTALAISSDHTTVASGHTTGHILTWDLAKPAKPFLHIPPLESAHLEGRKSDTHVADATILHLGYLGTRRTALVSADDAGMAFSHLATRGTGAVGRSVKTTRLLGRYPSQEGLSHRQRRASSVLALASLPLGNIEQATDNMGLTAILTPYLLVIVSTTPIAQTQHKASRPREVASHGALSGCLAWFPAVKLKTPSGNPPLVFSKSKLVYCWSNVLTILDIDDLGVSENSEIDKLPELIFNARARWTSVEAIVAVQWLSRSILAVLTITQRLFLLEDSTSLRVTDSFDLMKKHIYHHDFFSKQLQPVVDQLDGDDENETSVGLHGVVADAFYMSFRAYRSRLFLLSFDEVSVGALSNWNDRLTALVESGDHVAAVRLASRYYTGDCDKLTVGLPEEDTARHTLVYDRLLSVIRTTLTVLLSHQNTNDTLQSTSEVRNELCMAAFAACIAMNEREFLLSEVYTAFEDASMEASFFDILVSHLANGDITSLPPGVFNNFTNAFVAKGRISQLEEVICNLDTESMDIHQIVTLCKTFSLYDAYLYVWNIALDDFITPLVDLMKITTIPNAALVDDEEEEALNDERHWGSSAADRIFPYLAYILTGRVFPTGKPMEVNKAFKAKCTMYGFLFSGGAVEWPLGSASLIKFDDNDADSNVSFPYLRHILAYDSGSFMSMLNEAFVDGFLDRDAGDLDAVSEDVHIPFAKVLTRQVIVNILVEVTSMGQFDAERTIFLDIFIARNVAKFPQNLILPEPLVSRLLIDLCNFPASEAAEDCQLSVEYLLSNHQPADLMSLVPLLERAKFYRVLKWLYRRENRYADLLQTYLDDKNSQSLLFECITECFRHQEILSKKQLRQVKYVILANAMDIARLDAAEAAQSLELYAPEMIENFSIALQDEPNRQFQFLQTLYEPDYKKAVDQPEMSTLTGLPNISVYIRLMCKFEPSHVADFVTLLQASDLQLQEVLPELEGNGVIDAVVVLMAREGLVSEAMKRLVKHLQTLEAALIGILEAAADSPDRANTTEAVVDIDSAVQKYCRVGVWLCQSQGRTRQLQRSLEGSKSVASNVKDRELSFFELLWVDMIDAIVAIARNVSVAIDGVTRTDESMDTVHSISQLISAGLRSAIQQTFTALLAATSTSTIVAVPRMRSTPMGWAASTSKSAKSDHPSFLRILRAFLVRASYRSSSLSDLRAVLADVFAAYTFQETILSLAGHFIDNDVFVQLAEAQSLRERGWRPKSQNCDICNRRLWGLGAGAEVWEAWKSNMEAAEARRTFSNADQHAKGKLQENYRGKGRADASEPSVTKIATAGATGSLSQRATQAGKLASQPEEIPGSTLAPLVVFACRHIFHRSCLDLSQNHDGDGGSGLLRCPMSHLR